MEASHIPYLRPEIYIPGTYDAVGYATQAMHAAVKDFREQIENETFTNLDYDQRNTIPRFEPALLDTSDLPANWVPSIRHYSSEDPFQKNNPSLTIAAKGLIASTIGVAYDVAFTNDPTLTYEDLNRANGGKNATVITRALMSIDPATSRWITGLPRAEQLRPVAKPYIDGGAVTLDEDMGVFSTALGSKAFFAIVGGANDGWAVREREAVEKAIIADAFKDSAHKDSLYVTSFGTGTGEPAMDTALQVMRNLGGAFNVVVNGIDINPVSLAIAQELAKNKAADLSASEELIFTGSSENILSIEGIKDALTKGKVDVLEAVGLAEYIPSDNATDPAEIVQREKMRRRGLISAEEFYRAIWEYMPKGAVFVSGNMRDDSPEARFVTDGLGWKGIIQRSTKDYLTILKNAGIPASAVTLYAPKANGASSGVYNMVSIQK